MSCQALSNGKQQIPLGDPELLSPLDSCLLLGGGGGGGGVFHHSVNRRIVQVHLTSRIRKILSRQDPGVNTVPRVLSRHNTKPTRGTRQLVPPSAKSASPRCSRRFACPGIQRLQVNVPWSEDQKAPPERLVLPEDHEKLSWRCDLTIRQLWSQVLATDSGKTTLPF